MQEEIWTLKVTGTAHPFIHTFDTYRQAVDQAEDVVADQELQVTERYTSVGARYRFWETLEGAQLTFHRRPKVKDPDTSRVHCLAGHIDDNRRQFLVAYEQLWDDLLVGEHYPEHLVFFGKVVAGFIDINMSGALTDHITWDSAKTPAENAEILFDKMGKLSS